jgi:hypothetical protein
VIQRIVKNASMKNREDEIFNLKLGIRLYTTVLKNRDFFHGKRTQRFITTFTTACHQFLS